ncbi:hypothetical protein MXF13_13835 [Leclercia adecarboxylata]|uniref:hypothetical protein n=1 Tax=Leclercia TaxID=83654 RepID=UPI001E57B1C8|nr:MULTISPECIES: hypothetical protein [Leclercia]MEB5750950.1 hypothetical protein [Leclercia adecarboxylata]
MLTSSGMMYVLSDEKVCGASVLSLIMISADTINGVNTINADKAGKIFFNDAVVLFN